MSKKVLVATIWDFIGLIFAAMVIGAIVWSFFE